MKKSYHYKIKKIIFYYFLLLAVIISKNKFGRFHQQSQENSTDQIRFFNHEGVYIFFLDCIKYRMNVGNLGLKDCLRGFPTHFTRVFQNPIFFI